MSTYAKLPGLLWRIDVLAAGHECRSPGCYAEAYRWLSPYCEPECAPRVGRQGPTPGLLFSAAPFDRDAHALRTQIRIAGMLSALTASPRSLLQIDVC